MAGGPSDTRPALQDGTARLLGAEGPSQPASLCLPAAFEDMLENPLNSSQWMNDPETGPVVLQISRIFQTLNRA